MSTSTRNIVWIAAWLEGEGCFGYYLRRTKPRKFGPQIRASSTDLDTAEKAARILGVKVYPKKTSHRYKQVYEVRVHGSRAIGWMMTILAEMGARRGAKIRQIVRQWRDVTPNPGGIASVWARVNAVPPDDST